MAKIDPFFYQVVHLKSARLLVSQCRLADTFWDRLWGLMGQTHLNQDAGLWLTRCNQIHTWFMRLSIDVLFLRKVGEGAQQRFSGGTYEVIAYYSNVPPWRLLPLGASEATDTLELPAGLLQSWDLIKVGDQLCIN